MEKVIKLTIVLIVLYLQISVLSAQSWTVNPGDYEFSMNVTGQVYVEGAVIDQQNSYLGVFVNDECRGVVKPTSYEGNYKLFLLSIYSNITEGETLVFKLMDEAFQEYSIANKIRFVSDEVYGSADEPFLWMDVEQYASTDFLSFAFNNQISSATIDVTNRDIEILVSVGTDLSNLIPVFTLAPGAVAYIDQIKQVSDQTANDYTEVVHYTVIGVDNITANWVVEVKLYNSIEDYTKNKFNIYPNPAKEKIHIELKNTTKYYRFQIVDITGKIIFKQSILNNKTEIDISNFDTGIYLIMLQNKNEIYTERLIIK